MENDRDLEDKSLLEALKEGEQPAFDRIFRKYYPMLCAYARRFIVIEDAENVVQEVMLWFWMNRMEVTIESSLSQYLFKMTYHRALNQIAKEESSSRLENIFIARYLEMPQETDYYQVEELTKRIKLAIDILPESYREAFVMHRFKDMSYKEIAAQLEVSPKTIDYRIQQALKLLREDLKEYLPLVSFLLVVNSLR